MKRFKRVAVLKGGISTERRVSLRSGAAIARGLRERGFDVVEVDVRTPRFRLPAGVEAVFVALHGRYGEDGDLQARLERDGVPYTGSGPESCRLSFDKNLTREVLEKAGVPVPRGVVLTKTSARPPLPLPVVVKPSRQGSSVGCHRVFRASDWKAALADALRHDSEAVVEEFVPGRELTVGVIAAPAGARPPLQALPVVEIVAPDGYYDYRAKYTKGLTSYHVPAPIPAAVAREAQRLALRVFRALGARHLGRVDFRLRPDGRLFVLELNAIPGFTATSLLPKAAAASGISFPVLCERLLNLASV